MLELTSDICKRLLLRFIYWQQWLTPADSIWCLCKALTVLLYQSCPHLSDIHYGPDLLMRCASANWALTSKNPPKTCCWSLKESAARSTPAYRLLEFCHNITVTRNLLCTTKFDPGHLAHWSAHSLFLTPSPSYVRHHTFASFVLSLCAPLPSSFLLLFTCFLLQQHLTSSRFQIITLPYYLAFYVFSVFTSYWCLFHFTARPICVLPSSLCCSCLYG